MKFKVFLLAALAMNCLLMAQNNTALPEGTTKETSWMEAFKNPSRDFGMQPCIHWWPDDDIEGMADLLLEHGCRGAVINCRYNPSDAEKHPIGFTSDPQNVEFMKKVMDAMDERGLKYWIYDEKGYPSGYAKGLTLEGHPELVAKGFYMRRYAAYKEPRTIHFKLDEDSEKIVWAAKYKFSTPGFHESVLNTDTMVPVEFDTTSATFELDKFEVGYVFCVKEAYDGSHCTHNVSTEPFMHYINMMDPEAVRRFIDVAYEPIVQGIPDAYKRAGGVFTDEPSLQTRYVRNYEVWPYALAPWVDGLFERYEKEYGASLLPSLPYVFEGSAAAYPTRVRFQRLVGKLVGEAYSGQLQEWCKAHGGVFSGHYLDEENMLSHVYLYGDFIEVLKHTGYPGIDTFGVMPGLYTYGTTKFPQMAIRKNQTHGMMVELCPWIDQDQFMKDPLNNMAGSMGLLYLGGVRVINGYFYPDFTKWQNGRIKYRLNHRVDLQGFQWFNQYCNRIGTMLDGLDNNCNTFIYYGIEEVQAFARPSYTCNRKLEGTWVIDDTNQVMNAVYEAGHDFYFVDAEDVFAAGALDKPAVSGYDVKTIVVPTLQVVDEKAMEAFVKLQEKGVKILFMNCVPMHSTEEKSNLKALAANFKAVSFDDIMKWLDESNDGFRFTSNGVTVLNGDYITKEGREMHYLVNLNREDATLNCSHPQYDKALLCNPADGSVTEISLDQPVVVPAQRSLFLVF